MDFLALCLTLQLVDSACVHRIPAWRAKGWTLRTEFFLQFKVHEHRDNGQGLSQQAWV